MEKRITNIPLLRRNNINNILRLIWNKKVTTRKELSRLTSITAPTISDITNLLSKKGFINIKKKGKSTGGRQPGLIEFNPSVFYIIGINFGPYKVKAMITDLYESKIKEYEIDADHKGKGANILQELEIVLKGLLENFTQKDKIIGIGISIPGTIGDNGVIISSPSIGNAAGVNIPKFIRSKYGLPSYVENVANLGALNEYWFGKGKDSKYLLFVLAGPGIGNGLIVNGEIYTGAMGAAGEIGHTVIEPDGKKCYCGNYGCLETVASYSALFKEFKRRIKMGESTALSNFADKEFSIDLIKKIFDYAEKGDSLAISVLKQVGRYIGISIANLINILNPDIVIIGGDYHKVKSIIEGPLEKTIRSRIRVPVKDTKIVFTDFVLNEGVYGAVTMVLKKYFDNGFDFS